MSGAKPDISNLKKCTEDIVRAALESDFGPDDPTDYNQLLDRLQASQTKLPPLYCQEFFHPFVSKLDGLGQTGFTKILLRDPGRVSDAGLMLDIAHSILQNGEGFNEKATDSFQEVCSDLYDGFLSAEDRKGVQPPDRGVIAPLVKWGRPDDGPYTWPVDATSIFGCKAAVVNVPPANARSGLLAWAALGHETAGHDILHADTGLSQEITKAVQNALEDQGLNDGLPEYWSSRIDETASDVCGILNMGPAAGIGLIGYFRGLNKAFGGEPKLRNLGGRRDPHPADILRGYLAAQTVRLLSFGEANDWAQIIEAETNKDLSSVVLGDNKIPSEKAKKSAQIVASTIFNTKAESLENHALGEIQNWHNSDEEIVKEELIPLLTSVGTVPSELAEGIFAAHVVAAAVEAALSKDADISSIFSRMLGILKIMHDKNSSWGPMFVRQPGNIYRNMVYPVFDSKT